MLVVVLFGNSIVASSDSKYLDYDLNPSFRINQIRQSYLKTQAAPNNPAFLGFFDEPWRIPISGPSSLFVTQGYDGGFSHQGKKALDIASSGSVVATRSGRVGVVNFGGKWDQWCNSYNDCFNKGGIWNGNHVVINHPDGSSSYYIHLKANTLNPSIFVGRDVTIGTELADIGGTGFTCNLDCSGPFDHLHFQVNSSANVTIPTIFDDCSYVQNNCNNGILESNNTYYSINYSPSLEKQPGPLNLFGQIRQIGTDLRVTNNNVNWEYTSLNEFKIGSLCLTDNSSVLAMQACNNSTNQRWQKTEISTYRNQSTFNCLNLDSFALGTLLNSRPCDDSFKQQFRHSFAPIPLINFD